MSVNYCLKKDAVSFRNLIDRVIEAFEAFPLSEIPRKPRVGIVGEILVKFHPDAYNHAIDVIEQEGCEAVMPGLWISFSIARIIRRGGSKILTECYGRIYLGPID